MLVENKGSLISILKLSCDFAEIYKREIYFRNVLILDISLFNITVKAIPYYYSIVHYLNLIRHGLLTCDNSFFFLVISQHYLWLYVIFIQHRNQTIKWPFKESKPLSDSQSKDYYIFR